MGIVETPMPELICAWIGPEFPRGRINGGVCSRNSSPEGGAFVSREVEMFLAFVLELLYWEGISAYVCSGEGLRVASAGVTSLLS